MSVEQARHAAANINSAIADGENPGDARRKAKADLTFGELFQLYLDRHAKPHKRTWGEDQSKFEQYLTSNKEGVKLHTRRLASIDRSVIATLHAKIGASKAVAANRVLALLSSVFGRAIEWGIWERPNPAHGIKRFKEKSRERFLQASELPRFFAALRLEPNDSLRDFFLMALYTGARRSNVLQLRWDQIDFEAAEWNIPDTKNGTPQLVPLIPDAQAILARRRPSAESPFVFPGIGRTGHIAEPRKGFQRILDHDELIQLGKRIRQSGTHFAIWPGETLPHALGRARGLAKQLKLDTHGARLPDLHIHDLRRTLGSWQARTGASMIMIGKTLHHKSHAATQVYARLDSDPVRDSMEKAMKAIHLASGKSKSANPTGR